MKWKPVGDLCGPRGPEEVDDMLRDVDANRETYELISGGKIIARVVPYTGESVQPGCER